MKVNATGVLQWARSFQLGNSTRFTDISKANNEGGFILTGYLGEHNRSILVLELDKQGLNTSPDYPVLDITDELTSKDVSGLSAYPDYPMLDITHEFPIS